jgi:radical SAM superfamily enzyme YgiQ (UPF0313 family)
LNIAENSELLRLLGEANVKELFVGVESPNPASLRETNKMHNLSPHTSILDRLKMLHQAGFDLDSGMIVGFDNDDRGCFSAHFEFAQQSRIPLTMPGLLVAKPGTRLYKRLLNEKRLDLSGDGRYGTNVIPLKMSRQELFDGYDKMLTDLYQLDHYLERLNALYLDPAFRPINQPFKFFLRFPWKWVCSQIELLISAIMIIVRLLSMVQNKHTRHVYRMNFLRVLWRRRSPDMACRYAFHLIYHFHIDKYFRDHQGQPKC